MREAATAVVEAEGGGVAAGRRDGFGVLGPAEGVHAGGVEGATLPLAAAGTEHVELPVRRVGGGGRQDGVGCAGVGAGDAAGAGDYQQVAT